MKTFNLPGVRRFQWLALVVLAIAYVPQSQSAEVQTEVRAGVGVSDNIARTAIDAIDETVGSLGLTLNLISEQRRMNFDLQLDGDYLHYQDGTFDDEFVGGLIADVEFPLIYDRLSWLVVNNFGQQFVDPLVAPTPQNRENINFFTTGPRLTLPFGARNQIGVEAVFSDIAYEERQIDNQRGEGRVWLEREIRSGTFLSVNARAMETEFDDPILNTDYDIREAFLRVDRVLENGESVLSFDVGYSELTFGDAEAEDGILLRAELRNSISANTDLVLLAGSGYTDPSELFRFNQEVNFDGGATQNVDGNGIPFRADFANAIFELDNESTSATLNLGWRNEDFDDRAPRSRKILNATASIVQDVTSVVFVTIAGGYDEQDYEDLGRRDRNTSGTLGIGFRFGEAARVQLEYQRLERSSTEPQSEFVEDRVTLQFAYVPRWDARR